MARLGRLGYSRIEGIGRERKGIAANVRSSLRDARDSRPGIYRYHRRTYVGRYGRRSGGKNVARTYVINRALLYPLARDVLLYRLYRELSALLHDSYGLPRLE